MVLSPEGWPALRRTIVTSRSTDCFRPVVARKDCETNCLWSSQIGPIIPPVSRTVNYSLKIDTFVREKFIIKVVFDFFHLGSDIDKV